MSATAWNEIVTEELYPHGLRCADCESIIEVGDRTYERPASAVEEVFAHVPNYTSLTVMALVCESRANTPSERTTG